jgi:hypothetical protein
MISKSKICLTTLSAILYLAMLGAALAASNDEIQVYDDAINQSGKSGLDLHVNYVSSGISTPSWQGDAPANHSLRLTPEYSYGLSDSLEFGAYLPLLRDANGTDYVEGAKIRLKYIPAHQGSAFFWGVNEEFGRVSNRTEEQNWHLEVRPIVGCEIEKYKISLNPILNWAISGTHNNVPEFSPAIRVAYAVNQNLVVAVEHYSSLGPLNDLLPYQQQIQQTYVVMDTELAGHPIEFGVGKGWTSASDNWTFKTILSW